MRARSQQLEGRREAREEAVQVPAGVVATDTASVDADRYNGITLQHQACAELNNLRIRVRLPTRFDLWQEGARREATSAIGSAPRESLRIRAPPAHSSTPVLPRHQLKVVGI